VALITGEATVLVKGVLVLDFDPLFNGGLPFGVDGLVVLLVEGVRLFAK